MRFLTAPSGACGDLAFSRALSTCLSRFKGETRRMRYERGRVSTINWRGRGRRDVHAWEKRNKISWIPGVDYFVDARQFDRSTYRRRDSTCFPFSPLFFLLLRGIIFSLLFFSRLKSIARGQMFWFLDSVERRKGFGRGLILVPTRIMRHRFERFSFFSPPPLSLPSLFLRPIDLSRKNVYKSITYVTSCQCDVSTGAIH